MPISGPSTDQNFIWREASSSSSSSSSKSIVTLQSIRAFLPSFGFVHALQAYRIDWKENLTSDIGSGIVVAVMLIPQALAYALLSGMPAVTGFFSAILALFAYPVFGTSGYQAVGPVALMAIMSNTAVTTVAEALPSLLTNLAPIDRITQLSGRLALLIGIIQFMMGILKAGYLINFLSHPVLAGFTASSAIIIASSQLNKAFGFSIPTTDYAWETWYEVFSRVSTRTHGLSLGIFILNMFLFVLLTHYRQKLMATSFVKSRVWLKGILRIISVALIIVLFNILFAGLAQLDKKDLKVLGKIPSGLPTPTLSMLFGNEYSGISFSEDAMELLPSSLLISLISYVESASVAKSMQAKYGVTPGTLPVDGSQELLGLGFANVLTAIFNGFPVTGGFSRSGVQAEAGAKTVFSGVFTAIILCIVVSFITTWFYYLPDVALAAMIMFSALRLLESQTIRYLWKVDRTDAFVYILTILMTLGAGIETGLMVGAGVSLLRLVKEAANPHSAILGRMPDGVTYRNIKRFPTLAQQLPGIVIVRIDGPIFFANIGILTETILKASFDKHQPMKPIHEETRKSTVSQIRIRTAELPSPPLDEESMTTVTTDNGTESSSSSSSISSFFPLRAIILDMSGVSSIDSSGVHALLDTLPSELQRVSKVRKLTLVPQLFCVGVHGPVRDRLYAGEVAHHTLAATPTTGSHQSSSVVQKLWQRLVQRKKKSDGTDRTDTAVSSNTNNHNSNTIDINDDDDDDGHTDDNEDIDHPTGNRADTVRIVQGKNNDGTTSPSTSTTATILSTDPGTENVTNNPNLTSWPGLTPFILARPETATQLLRQVDLSQAIDAVTALLQQQEEQQPNHSEPH